MATQSKFYSISSVVERAIDIVGKPRELMDRIGAGIGETISRQRFQGWRQREAFSIDAIIVVHQITKIPYTDLIMAIQNSTAKKKAMNGVDSVKNN